MPITVQTGWALLHCSAVIAAPNFIYCDTCFFADFALTCVYRDERCILNVAYFKFFMCSMARDIVWPFCMFLYKRELSYLTENRYMEVDSLPVEPACFSFFFFLKLYLPLFKKKRKKPPFRNHLSCLGSFMTANWKAILKNYSHFFLQRFN